MRKPGLSLALSLALSALTTCSKPTAPTVGELPASAATDVPIETGDDVHGLLLRLSDAFPPAAGAPAVPAAEATALSEARTAALLARVPALPAEEGDQLAFARRADSQPPPLTGATVQEIWPPPEQPPAPEVAPTALEVLRFSPEGEVVLAPKLSISFNQPMVAVTSQDEASATVPVELTPHVDGHWRWIGTRTLLFEPDPRFAMATEYSVRVPAGSVAPSGAALARDAAWSFGTPPVSVLLAYPGNGPQRLDPLIFLSFDQKIDPEALLPFVGLTGEGHRVPLVPASAEQLAADEAASRLARNAEPGRWVALVPSERLQPDTRYSLSLLKGAPSAEGPRVTTADQNGSFQTYPPLKIVRDGCSTGEGGCMPGSPVWLRFTNPLDEDAFDPALVSVSPPVEHLRVIPSSSTLNVYGDFLAATKYTVSIGAGLRDDFGQNLAKADQRSFDFGHLRSSLRGPGKDMVVLDPAAPPTLSVYSVNHERLKLRVYKVEPDDWGQARAWVQGNRYDRTSSSKPPFAELADTRIDVAGYADDQLAETAIDLEPYTRTGSGHLLLWIEPEHQQKERWQQTDLRIWVQRTAIGLTALVDSDEVVAWATSLQDGSPLPGVSVRLLGTDRVAETDRDGLARLGKYKDTAGVHALLASQGSDEAFLPDRTDWNGSRGTWIESTPDDGLQWFVFDDRQMYRPGETVRVKGWLRGYDRGAGGGPTLLPSPPSVLSWTLTDARGVQLGTGAAQATPQGGFDLSIDLPDTPNLGVATLMLQPADGAAWGRGSSHRHSFQIQEFRRPEFEVAATVDPRPYVLGDEAFVTASARYYTGAPLPDAPVSWDVSWLRTSYSPPGHSDYRFGEWLPWWYWDRQSAGSPGGREHHASTTDPLGGHTLKVEFAGMNPPGPMAITAEAGVSDVNRQRWAAKATMMLHPSSVYVGLKPDKGFYEEGDTIRLDSLVVGIDGEVVSGLPFGVELVRLAAKRVDGRWTQVPEDARTCDRVSGPTIKPCEFEADQGGQYRVTATVADALGRPNHTTFQLWVSGGDDNRPPMRNVSSEELTLVPDKDSYRVGDTLRLMVQSPFFPAEGLVQTRRNGIIHTQAFRMDKASTVVEVVLGPESVPNLHVQVEVVGSAERRSDDGLPLPDKARRVALASSGLELTVPAHEQTLQVSARPASSALSPGGSTQIELAVRDAAGLPVQGAEVALWVVDESVLALSGYTLPDPVSAFYLTQSEGVRAHHSRVQVVLANPERVGEGDGSGDAGWIEPTEGATNGGAGFGSGAPGGTAEVMTASAMRSMSEEPEALPPPSPRSKSAARNGDAEPSGITTPIEVRSDFSALALFMPAALTDSTGKATVPVTVPDNLTRYRVMAVAVKDLRMGSTEDSLTARLPLMLRPSPPRFMNFGDRIELPLVVQNQTDEPLAVDLALAVSNATVIDSMAAPGQGRATAGRHFTVPANDRREVRIPVASDRAGTARFQAVVASGNDADAARFELPVWTPATSEAFATYGEIDEGALVQPVSAPGQVWPQFGGLEITTSSTALQALTDAVLYLDSYPYDCSEQLASRILAIASLKDVLSAFEAEQLPPPELLLASVDEDLLRLKQRQQSTGGWGFWGRTPVEPYLSVHVTHALAVASAKGFAVDEGMLSGARGFLKRIDRHIPGWYSESARRLIEAYAVYVRHRLGDDDGREALRVLDKGTEALSAEGMAFLLPVLQATGHEDRVAEILRYLENHVSETSAHAMFTTGYTDDNDYVLLHSSRRTDGIVLDALMQVRPQHDLIPKVTKGLLAHRVAGHWSTTQENAFVLLAMDRYFETYESVTPDFVARVWLGGDLAGEHAFQGRTTERSRIDVPMAALAEAPGPRDLVLAKDGKGRLYYRVGLRYAPLSLDLEPADYGFEVLRAYEPVDDPADVRQDDDGVWHIAAGARVRVRVTMVATSRRTHVMLTDPLPAGLEPMNPALAVTGSIPDDPTKQSGGWWWRGTWYQHQNLRDERAEAFTSLLWHGVHEYSYVAAATTPGRFVVPPAKAEEMYQPETFGRSGSDVVWVE